MQHELYILDHGKDKKDFHEKKIYKIFFNEIFSGTHHKKFCSSESDIARWKETDNLYQNNRKYLFPTIPLSVHLKNEGKRPFKKPNGGWSDLRDRQLCLSFAFKDAKNLSSF